MRDLEFNIKAKDATRSGFDAARNNARAFNGELDMTGRGLELAATAARAFAGAFTLTAVAEFGSYVKTVIDDVSALVDLSDKIGVGIEDLQKLRYGFGQAGVEAGTLDQSLVQWSKRIGEAYTNGGRLADIFKANNIQLTDGEGRLRSSVDLMRSYAELIASAGSEQEQMTLATEGFGRAGGVMILALKDGADGMQELMDSTEEAGGVLDEELARRLEGIGDDMSKMWHRFEIDAQTAVGRAVVFLDDMRITIAEIGKARNAALAGQDIGAMFGQNLPTEKGDRLKLPIDQRIDSAFGNFGETNADNAALERELRSRYAKQTIIPGGGDDKDSRSRSAKAAREQETAYERVIERLREEEQVIGLTDVARRVAIEQQRAGVEASSAEGMAISDLVTKIESQQSAYEAAADASEFMRDNLKQSFADILPQIDTGNSALDGFINRLAQAAAEAIFFGDGPLGSILGAGGGLFKSFGGGRAVGGGVDPFKDYLVGENGPELLRIGSRGGRVGEAPTGKAAAPSGPQKLALSVNVKGANGDQHVIDLVRQGVTAGLDHFNRNVLPGRVSQISDDPYAVG